MGITESTHTFNKVEYRLTTLPSPMVQVERLTISILIYSSLHGHLLFGQCMCLFEFQGYVFVTIAIRHRVNIQSTGIQMIGNAPALILIKPQSRME